MLCTLIFTKRVEIPVDIFHSQKKRRFQNRKDVFEDTPRTQGTQDTRCNREVYTDQQKKTIPDKTKATCDMTKEFKQNKAVVY